MQLQVLLRAEVGEKARVAQNSYSILRIETSKVRVESIQDTRIIFSALL